MAKKLIASSWLIFLSISLMADGNEALFEAANGHYANGNFEEAITGYQQILQTRQESSEVYYNLANAYFKTNQLSLAILHYERGLLLSPGDEDIRYNLAIANELITDKIETLPEFFLTNWIQGLRSALAANTWALMSLLFFFLAGGLVITFVFSRKRAFKTLSLAGIVLTLFLSIGSLLFARNQTARLTDHNTAIVFSPSVTIKSSPDQSGNDLFILHEGVKVEILDRLSGWFEIRIADGNVGWIPTDAVEII